MNDDCNYNTTYEQTLQVLSTGIDVFNLLVNLPVNSYVIWIIAAGPSSALNAEIFHLSLAICEIFFCISSILFLMYNTMSSVILGDAGGFFAAFLSAGRPLFQCCMCVESYLAVLHPLTFLKLRPLRYRLAVAAVAWTLTISSCVATSSLIAFDFLIWVPLALTLFLVKLYCCLAVLRALKRPRPGDGGKERDGANQAKMKAFKIISVILLSELLTYMPLVLYAATKAYLSSCENQLLPIVIFFIMLAMGLISPLLYLHRAGKLPRLTAGHSRYC